MCQIKALPTISSSYTMIVECMTEMSVARRIFLITLLVRVAFTSVNAPNQAQCSLWFIGTPYSTISVYI